MEVFSRMLSTQALMFVYMLLGVVMAKTRLLRQEARSSFISLLIDIALPCMILHSFEQEAGVSELLAAGKVLLISAGYGLASWALGKVIWRRKEKSRRAVLEFATMFSNAGNAGLPIVALVFGSEGVFYASFFLIPVRILMWTIGLSLFVQGGDGAPKWKKLLLNPSLLVVFIGIPMMLVPIRLPQVLSQALTQVGGMTGPLSMMLIGASLADTNLRTVLDRDAFALSFVRLIAFPLLLMALLRLIGVESLICQVGVTLLAMPAAANTAILSEMYGHDYSFAAKCVVLSTILSLVTVPCIALLF